MTAWTFNDAQLQEAASRYVEEGSPLLRAERQADADGALRFLRSDACRKFRPEPQFNYSDHER